MVETYPWVTDAGALLNQLAAEAGQPSAVELLGFGEFGVHASTESAIKSFSHLHNEVSGSLIAARHTEQDAHGTGVLS